jgi:hypothetical protein
MAKYTCSMVFPLQNSNFFQVKGVPESGLPQAATRNLHATAVEHTGKPKLWLFTIRCNALSAEHMEQSRWKDWRTSTLVSE